MKFAHAQLHMYTNILYKFQSSTCKTVGEKLWTKLCPWIDGQTDSHGDSSITPLHFIVGGVITFKIDKIIHFALMNHLMGRMSKHCEHCEKRTSHFNKDSLYFLAVARDTVPYLQPILKKWLGIRDRTFRLGG